MAAIDYTTLCMKNGKRVEEIETGNHTIEAWRGMLFITDKDSGKEIRISDTVPSDACEAGITDIRTIILDDEEKLQNRGKWEVEKLADLMKRFSVTDRKTGRSVDMKRFFIRHRTVFTEIKEPQKLIIFRIADSVFFWFYNNEAMGGASYAYILSDNGELSVIASGYGHYNNPALHWIDRGLSENTETEITDEFWREMTNTSSFHRLIAGRVFKKKKFNRDGSFTIGGFTEDTLTDKDAVRLYNRISEIQEERK